jgi:hypothetical protein
VFTKTAGGVLTAVEDFMVTTLEMTPSRFAG